MAALPVLLVFGATGATGSEVVKQALADGVELKVRAFVRNPSKVPKSVSENERFEIFEGDITNAEKVDEACEGVKYIISCLGDKAASKAGPFMVPFCERVIAACRKHGVERFLYQAGGFSPLPGEKMGMMGKVFGVVLGMKGMIAENTKCLELMQAAKDVKTIGTRPGMLGVGPGKGGAKAVSKMPSGKLLFADLAEFSLKAVQTSEYDGTFPLIGY